MSRFSTLFGCSELSSLEKQVLEAVSSQLSPPARDIFDKQINLVNKIQRLADGKEVDLYAKRRGKPFLEDQLRFPFRSEAQLAAVEIETVGGKEPINAEVWLVNGRVFSIEFSKPPKVILERGVAVIKTRILHDPMIEAPVHSISEEKRREQLLSTIRSKLPDEYLQLVGQGKGIRVSDWAVSAIQDIRKIVQRDGNYYVLAEKVDMGAIGIKEEEFSGQLYYLDYGDDRGEKITVSLQKFLEEFDGGKVDGRF